MKVKIHRILGVTILEYINFVDAQFSDWCQPIAKTHFVPNRVLTANTQLYNWFIENFDKRVVMPFLNDTATYIEAGIVSPAHYLALFNDQLLTASGIYNIYPSVLIKQIKTAHYEKINAQQENS